MRDPILGRRGHTAVWTAVAALGALGIWLMLFTRTPTPAPAPARGALEPSVSAPTRPSFRTVTLRAAGSTLGADASELGAIRQLVGQGRIGPARARAQQFFESFPDSALRAEVERLTGVHPRPAPGD